MDFSRLDKFLEEHLAYYGFHGCDTGVVYKGETVYRKQFGIDDCETGKKIYGNELYYIFSASKPSVCSDEGLPKCSVDTSIYLLRASGQILVVALLSRYICLLSIRPLLHKSYRRVQFFIC